MPQGRPQDYKVHGDPKSGLKAKPGRKIKGAQLGAAVPPGAPMPMGGMAMGAMGGEAPPIPSTQDPLEYVYQWLSNIGPAPGASGPLIQAGLGQMAGDPMAGGSQVGL